MSIFRPILYFFLGGFVFLGICSWAWWAWFGRLPNQVQQLQQEIEILKKQPDSLKTQALSLEKLDFKIEKVEKEIRSDFDWIQKAGLPLTLLAFAGLFFSLYKSALGFALQKAKETVDRYYLPDEERFKREKKLLILTKEGGDSQFIRRLLHDTGFLAASTIPETNIKDLTEKELKTILGDNQYDLILLNNENKSFEDTEIRICHSKTPDYTMIFSFSKNLPSDLVSSQRVSSANFKSQIYSNLINALKYQQYLRK